MISHYFSPLRYPGGKSGLGPWIAHLMRRNSISGGTYVEPYAGGAGVALYLLFNGYVNRIIINDADPVIFKFWKSILDTPEEFLDLVERTEVTMDNWHRMKRIIENQELHTILQTGFATFFLNRTNRSGILKGGVIGGQDQTGKYKLNARFNKSDLITRIRKISTYSEQIELYGIDALELVEIHRRKKQSRSLIYLDPPYYIKGSQLYRNFYTTGDHAEIANKLASLETPWLVTYDNCPEIGELYKKPPDDYLFAHVLNSRRPSIGNGTSDTRKP